MGLDFVEIIIAVEEAFQIAIPDADAERMRTPRNMVEYVMSRIGSEKDSRCLEQRAFYRLRRAIMQVFERPRKAIRPNTRWQEIITHRQTRHNWELLHQATGTPQWPKLNLLGKIPKRINTVGAVARYLAENARASLKIQADEGWSKQEIEATITKIIQKQLAINDFR